MLFFWMTIFNFMNDASVIMFKAYDLFEPTQLQVSSVSSFYLDRYLRQDLEKRGVEKLKARKSLHNQIFPIKIRDFLSEPH